MLVWLGIVSDDGEPVDEELWDRVRFPDTRAEALGQLIQRSYRAVFDAVEVAEANREQLNIEFARIYGLGDAKNRVTTFIRLCELANIPVGATRRGEETPSFPARPVAAGWPLPWVVGSGQIPVGALTGTHRCS